MMVRTPVAILEDEVTLRMISPAKDGGAEKWEKPGLGCLWDHCDNPRLPPTGLFKMFL